MIKWFSIVSINILVFVFLFLFLEVSTRIFFPNFLEAIDYDIDEYSVFVKIKVITISLLKTEMSQT